MSIFCFGKLQNTWMICPGWSNPHGPCQGKDAARSCGNAARSFKLAGLKTSRTSSRTLGLTFILPPVFFPQTMMKCNWFCLYYMWYHHVLSMFNLGKIVAVTTAHSFEMAASLFWRISSAVVAISCASVIDVTWFSCHVCQTCSCRNDPHNSSMLIHEFSSCNHVLTGWRNNKQQQTTTNNNKKEE